ncbi:metalloprotease PmbA [Alteromonas sediminis]|uniref:Metalloprotease PmbA n=1 Tax=Alteromonas sediminis TaxID=2259342 RepID=A0A3N5XXV5_9ALTE|nr:metalloprotease PmbA [Alteromonas sediminis]RPJ65313.1 metalloprotease PmbA [Alteromonas sediminis]
MQVDKVLPQSQQIVADVLHLATQKGATQAEASLTKVQGIAVSTRLREVENVEFTQDNTLGISVYVGKHKGSASTADLSQEALSLAVEKAIHIAKYTNEDECSGLADEALIATEFPDLELYHPIALDTQQGMDLALETENAALSADSRITNSDGATFNGNIGASVYGNTHGINAGQASSRYSLSCMVIASEGKDMQRDYAYSVNRCFNDLNSPKNIGEEAAESVVSRLGARKIGTQECPVLFSKEIASSLFGHLVSAISGGALYRRSTFLLDHLNKPLFPEWLTIQERPRIKRALASSNFDHEGVATQDMDIVQDGILKHYLYTSYSARKLGVQTNGHAGGIHNWLISHSGHSDKDMLAELGTGLFVTELMGQGVNTVTGDYSRGAAGFWVENGVIQYPVHEVTIAGNLKQMFANIIAIGKEKELRGAVQTGSILLSSMRVAGD